MAAESDNVTRRALLCCSLASWKFFLPLAALPVLWALIVLPHGWLQILLVINGGYCAFGCWRLWLDERYFALITEQYNALAGDALAFIWQRERLGRLTLEERETGARRQLHHTLKATMLAWVLWLIALVTLS